MPRGIGVFERTNGQFNGSRIWQDDLEAEKKIIAFRHDTHDEDLAIGIAQCLPKDGSESMLGSINFGGFTALNSGQAAAGQLLQVPNYGQIITSATFDEPTRTLTLFREGMSNLAVTIQSGGDNTIIQEGIEQIFAGTGIKFGNGNEMSEGNPVDTISLTATGVSAGTYSRPQSVSVNAQGRITSITSGAANDVDLGVNVGTSTVEITNSAGNNATIPAATNLAAGVMTKQQVIDLANASVLANTDLSLAFHTHETLTIDSSTGLAVEIPFATQTLAGLMTAADKVLLDNASGDPDQTLSQELPTETQLELNLSKVSGEDSVLLPSATSGSAGLLSAAAAKQISRLAVDGSGLTASISWDYVSGFGTLALIDHTNTEVAMPDWTTVSTPLFKALGGQFYGWVGTVLPTQNQADNAADNTIYFLHD